MDFGSNYFTGSLPLFGKSQRNLKVAKLNNNNFSGSIKADIGEMSSLNNLLIFSNSITGVLPSQLGQLTEMSSISVAYNRLKGTIPPEVSNMRNLSMMHLHSNMLTGDLSYFDYTIESFISDCGSTEASKARLDCPGCSECCNVDGDCLKMSNTWPKKMMTSIVMSPGLFVLLLLIGVSIILFAISVFIRMAGTRLPHLPYEVRQSYQMDSVNRWLLSSSKMAWFIASLSILFQIWIAFMFLRAGDATSSVNLWLYSTSCPDDRTYCTDQRKTNLAGWLTYVFVVAIFLLKDFFSGFLLFYESTLHFNIRGMIAGMVLLNITTLTIVASAIFLYATSISNITLVKDAVIVLFLNDIDEQVLMFLQTIAPGWTDEVEDSITQEYLYELKQSRMEENSDVIEDDKPSHFEYFGDIVADIANTCDEDEPILDGNQVDDENDNSVTNKCDKNMEDVTDKCVNHVEFDNLKESFDNLKESHDNLKESHDNLKESYDNMKEELKLIKDENSRLKAAISHSKTDIEVMDARAGEDFHE